MALRKKKTTKKVAKKEASVEEAKQQRAPREGPAPYKARTPEAKVVERRARQREEG